MGQMSLEKEERLKIVITMTTTMIKKISVAHAYNFSYKSS
jgi:hypothetical protein